jgi:hypothetical protein
MSEITSLVPEVNIVHRTKTTEELIVRADGHEFTFNIPAHKQVSKERFDNVDEIPVPVSEIDGRIEGLRETADYMEGNDRSLARSARLLPFYFLVPIESLLIAASGEDVYTDKGTMAAFIGGGILAMIGIGEFGARLSRKNSNVHTIERFRSQANTLESIKPLAIPTQN